MMIKEPAAVSLPSLHMHHVWTNSIGQETEYPVTLIVAPSLCSFYTMQRIIKKAFEVRNIQLVSLSIRDRPIEEIKKILATSFLGQKLFYWLYDLENVSRQTLTSLFQYLMPYTDPHRVIMPSFLDSIVVSEWRGYTIKFPADLTRSELNFFCTTWYPADVIGKNIQRFFMHYEQVTFNCFSSVFAYIPLLGSTLIDDFETKYLPRLFIAESVSLFSFMDLFWHKKIVLFYARWRELRQLYGDQFWISFWSDQFFRAYFYADCMQKGSVSIAQQIAARKLSFFYSKTAWRSVDMVLLKQLHNNTYMLDFMSKNGGSIELIEYFYIQWFTQQK